MMNFAINVNILYENNDQSDTCFMPFSFVAQWRPRRILTKGAGRLCYKSYNL